jgi:hypothetical protein
MFNKITNINGICLNKPGLVQLLKYYKENTNKYKNLLSMESLFYDFYIKHPIKITIPSLTYSYNCPWNISNYITKFNLSDYMYTQILESTKKWNDNETIKNICITCNNENYFLSVVILSVLKQCLSSSIENFEIIIADLNLKPFIIKTIESICIQLNTNYFKDINVDTINYDNKYNLNISTSSQLAGKTLLLTDKSILFENVLPNLITNNKQLDTHKTLCTHKLAYICL